MNIKLLSALISASFIVTACGGGSSTTTSLAPTAKNTYLLKGTVPGTLIEAYCDDGSVHSVSSTKNGTSKHPFSLSLPQGLACRVVMITNENDLTKKVVTPIKFMNQQGVASTVIRSDNGKDIDLGHVDLSLSRADMTADSNNDGVEDLPKEIILKNNDVTVVKLSNDPLDKDNDGIVNVYEDDDGDGISNHDDNDDDGDGILDINDNDHNNDGVSDNDLDGDGVTNDKDIDIDNDGISNAKDKDDDNDGIDDSLDRDNDNDGIGDDKDSDRNDVGKGGNDNGSGSNDDGKGGNDNGSGGNDSDNDNDRKKDNDNDRN